MTGLLRVKNEARWIERCISSALLLCDRILVMDDHSSDGTQELCAAMPAVTVFPSPFEGLDETRDKNWLLQKAATNEWIMMIDGDEMLDPVSVPEIRAEMGKGFACLSPKILYLWDREDQARVDGVYGRFRRPSFFRAGLAKFQATSAGGNFHCGNAPIALQPSARQLDATFWHFGYMHRADRIRKYQWYNEHDPQNENEDGYRHMVQGDVPEVPAWAKLRHGGPLQLVSIREGGQCSLVA